MLIKLFPPLTRPVFHGPRAIKSTEFYWLLGYFEKSLLTFKGDDRQNANSDNDFKYSNVNSDAKLQLWSDREGEGCFK